VTLTFDVDDQAVERESESDVVRRVFRRAEFFQDEICRPSMSWSPVSVQVDHQLRIRIDDDVDAP
jgi:hypothetical protein